LGSITGQNQRALLMAGSDPNELLPRPSVQSLMTWPRGAHRGVSDEHLQVYLDQFVFRFNRLRTPMTAFQTSLGLGSQPEPVTYREIVAAPPPQRSEPDKHIVDIRAEVIGCRLVAWILGATIWRWLARDAIRRGGSSPLIVTSSSRPAARPGPVRAAVPGPNARR